MTKGISSRSDVIVIGGGIHGVSVGYHLAGLGYAVTLLERDRIGRHASGVNAGSIHHIPRVYFELPLADDALSLWPMLAAELGEDCGFRKNGFLRVVETESDLQTAHVDMEQVRRHSTIQETWLDRDALSEVQPGLGASIIGGIWTEACGSADPAQTLRAYRKALMRRGVAIHEGQQVVQISRRGDIWTCTSTTDTFEAPLLVNCAGAWGDRIAALVGERFELTRQALLMSVTARSPEQVGPVIGHVGRRLSIKQAHNGTIIVGGGYRGRVALSSTEASVDFDRLSYNLALATHVLPLVRRAPLVRCWAGVEGFSPRHAAYIGASSQNENLWHCFGFSAHGFYIGPVVGKLLCDAIDTRITPEKLRPFGTMFDAESAVQTPAGPPLRTNAP